MADVIDLRSDTVTHPTPRMREAMARAEVGDDSYRDDPTVNRLQEVAADKLGKEDALFVASGTMGNLVSLLTWSQGRRGGEIVLGDQAHIIHHEAGGYAALAGLAAMPAERGRAGGRLLARLRAAVAGASIAAVSVVALAVLGASVATAGGPATTAPGALKAVRIGAVTVLADANGRTLYWFAPDTAARSACYGSCAAYWPPVKGPATAGPGVTGKLSVLTRSDGSVQAAYDGHPLYTYVGDSAPGQANGNELNLNGGLWHEVTASG